MLLLPENLKNLAWKLITKAALVLSRYANLNTALGASPASFVAFAPQIAEKNDERKYTNENNNE